jgi:hypothetical protein
VSTPTGDWQVPREYQEFGRHGVYVPVGHQPIYLVPRPPRPAGVVRAVGLTCVGAGVATVQFVVAIALGLGHGGLNDLTLGGPSPVTVPVGLIFVVAALAQVVVPAGGALAAAIFTARGSNAARIVLATLMGLFALANLCQGAGSLTGPDAGGAGPYAEAGLSLVDLGLAVTVGVLLLTPAANRYFLPGPGRRFAPTVTPVPSTYDRP